ncbi:maleylpyruvate isomerase family mycothiol-dependent enzyme [Nostocoides sp. F2B08]|uniref:maleylpyruvate isomerase family mycothiol-dependent enzyme n=1 Tax=Nostocoides sp. F2B08 TaxID=2653936 RepID=UPI00186B1060|nr:maleylpyruvate isomerase family mycothiol-dependent enzyme [Tetrasphaera sp. F2B08]
MSFAHVSPAPPMDLAGLATAYEQTARAVLALGRGCPPERAGDPTPCPGWDVFAQVAHVESLESMFLGEPPPQVDIGRPEHVRSDMGGFIEQLVESRRGMSLADLCDRLESAIDRRVRHWRTSGLTLEAREPGPFGMSTVGDVLSIRCFDIWTHEQDLRETLGEPGGLDSPAASIAMSRLYAALGRVVVRAGVPVGESVVVELSGPVTGRQGARVAEVDGRLRGVLEDVSDEDARCVLTLGTREMGRLGAGRVPMGEAGGFPWTATGDLGTAAALVAHFAVTP